MRAGTPSCSSWSRELLDVDAMEDFRPAGLVPLRPHRAPLVLRLTPAGGELLRAAPFGPARAHEEQPGRTEARGRALGLVLTVDRGEGLVHGDGEVGQRRRGCQRAR